MGRGVGGWSVGRWIAWTALTGSVGAPVGAALAVQVARSAVIARDGDPGDGIGYVVPALAGSAAGVLLVLVVASTVLLIVGSEAECAWVARGIAVVPVAAAAPLTLLALAGSPRALAVALLPLVITCVAAGAAWRSPQVGVVVMGGFVVGGVATILVLGLDAVVLLVPHLTISLGAWAVAGSLLARTVLGRDRRPLRFEAL